MVTPYTSGYSGAEIDAGTAKTVFLPSSLTGSAAKILAVNAGATGFEFVTRSIPAGTVLAGFLQASAPVGWTIKSDWAANASLCAGNAYSSGGSDSPTSWTTAVGVGNHTSHAHTGPDHYHAGSHHYHDTTVPRAGWGRTNESVTGNLAVSLAGTYGETMSATARSLESGWNTEGNTGSAGTGNTGTGGPTTHSVTQDIYTPIHTISIAATKDA